MGFCENIEGLAETHGQYLQKPDKIVMYKWCVVMQRVKVYKMFYFEIILSQLMWFFRAHATQFVALHAPEILHREPWKMFVQHIFVLHVMIFRHFIERSHPLHKFSWPKYFRGKTKPYLEKLDVFIRWWLHGAISGSCNSTNLRCMRMKKSHRVALAFVIICVFFNFVLLKLCFPNESYLQLFL